MPPLRVERFSHSGRPQGSPLRRFSAAIQNGASRRPRPTKGESLQSGRVRTPAPTADVEAFLSFRRGRTLAGPSNGFCHSGAHPHPPRIRSAPSPWKGEGFRVVRCADPTSEGEETFPLIRLTFGQPPSPRGRLVLPALARQSQARKGNRAGNNFCKPRAQWPGRDWYQPLRFCAPEILLRLSGTRLP